MFKLVRCCKCLYSILPFSEVDFFSDRSEYLSPPDTLKQTLTIWAYWRDLPTWGPNQFSLEIVIFCFESSLGLKRHASETRWRVELQSQHFSEEAVCSRPLWIVVYIPFLNSGIPPPPKLNISLLRLPPPLWSSRIGQKTVLYPIVINLQQVLATDSS